MLEREALSTASHLVFIQPDMADSEPETAPKILQFPTRQSEPVEERRISSSPGSEMSRKLGIVGYVSLNESSVKREFPMSGEWTVDGNSFISVHADMANPSIMKKFGAQQTEISPFSGKPQYVLSLEEGKVEVVHRYT